MKIRHEGQIIWKNNGKNRPQKSQNCREQFLTFPFDHLEQNCKLCAICFKFFERKKTKAINDFTWYFHE